MTPDPNEQTKQGRQLRNLLQTAGVLITLLASLATLASLWFQVRKTTPQLEVVTQYAQNLTSLPRVPQLSAAFKYADRDVVDLWQVKLTIRNSGSKTIIGEGPQKNIIEDSIIYTLEKGFELLDVQTDTTDFPNEVRKVGETDFASRFLQWRPKESVSVVLYLERKDKTVARPHFRVAERYILDGDIVFVDASAGIQTPAPLLDRMPALVANTLRVFSCIVLGLIAGFMAFVLFKALREALRFSTWRRKHFTHFTEFVRREFPQEAETILRKPASAEDQVWAKYPGEKPKARKLLFEGEKQMRSYAIFGMIALLLIVAQVVAVLGMIII